MWMDGEGGLDSSIGSGGQVLDIKPDAVTALGKSPQTVKARMLLCFWAHRKLGMTTVEIVNKLNLCQSAVSAYPAGEKHLQIKTM